MPADIQSYIWIEHLLPKTCKVQHPRGAREFGYTIKKQEDLIYICSLNLTWISAAFQHLIFFNSENRKQILQLILYYMDAKTQEWSI